MNHYEGSGAFAVAFNQRLTVTDGGAAVATPLTLTVLGSISSFSLLPSSNAVTLGGSEIGSLVSPFFLSDSRRTFFVEPELVETTIETFESWLVPDPGPAVVLPPHIVDNITLRPFVPELVRPDFGSPIPPKDNPWPEVFRNLPDDVLTGPSTGLLFGDRVLGPRGTVDVTTLTARKGLFTGPGVVREGSPLLAGGDVQISDHEPMHELSPGEGLEPDDRCGDPYRGARARRAADRPHRAQRGRRLRSRHAPARQGYLGSGAVPDQSAEERAMSNFVTSTGFHAYADGVFATIAKETFTPLKPLIPIQPRPPRLASHHIVVRERNLTHSFAPHYHPYVGELTRRLLTGSTRGLQAVDTEYRTRVKVTAEAKAVDDDDQVTIAVDEQVFLPDGIGLTVSGEPARLAGRHIVTADDQPFASKVGDAVVVPAEVDVVRANGSTATLSAEAAGDARWTRARCPRCTARSSATTRRTAPLSPAAAWRRTRSTSWTSAPRVRTPATTGSCSSTCRC